MQSGSTSPTESTEFRRSPCWCRRRRWSRAKRAGRPNWNRGPSATAASIWCRTLWHERSWSRSKMNRNRTIFVYRTLPDESESRCPRQTSRETVSRSTIGSCFGSRPSSSWLWNELIHWNRQRTRFLFGTRRHGNPSVRLLDLCI